MILVSVMVTVVNNKILSTKSQFLSMVTLIKCMNMVRGHIENISLH